jgi:hypothetical protein
MKLIEAKAVVEYKAPQHGALIMLVPAIRVPTFWSVGRRFYI